MHKLVPVFLMSFCIAVTGCVTETAKQSRRGPSTAAGPKSDREQLRTLVRSVLHKWQAAGYTLATAPGSEEWAKAREAECGPVTSWLRKRDNDADTRMLMKMLAAETGDPKHGKQAQLMLKLLSQ